MSNIRWLDVVDEYSKRCPNVTVGNLLGEVGYKECDGIMADCFPDKNRDEEYHYISHENVGYIFSTSEKCGEGVLEYYNNHGDWITVPDYILLRLLTEGKVDKI